MNNLLTRSLSGTLFVAIIISSILLSPISFGIVFSILSALAIREFHLLTNDESKEVSVSKRAAVGGSLVLFGCTYLFASGTYEQSIFSVYGYYIVFVILSELYKKKTNPIHNWAYFLLGQIMIALPFALLCTILYTSGYQPKLLLALFVTIWVNDTGAYLVGISIGKHRLFERISPKKSWEGFVGGAVAAMISGYVFSIYIPELSLSQWLIFSELIVIFGTYGDLSESLLKRTLGVKDSGNMIPGHGGLLDRFDSMLLAAPIIYIYLSIMN